MGVLWDALILWVRKTRIDVYPAFFSVLLTGAGAGGAQWDDAYQECVDTRVFHNVMSFVENPQWWIWKIVVFLKVSFGDGQH